MEAVPGTVASGYVGKLALAVAAVAGLLLGFIWLVDPYGVSPLNVTIAGFNEIKPKRLDIDRQIKPFEVWRKQPRTVFLGTSRIHQSMDPAVMDGSDYAPAYNASVPAMSLGMNVSYLEHYATADDRLESVFVELFIYNFLGQNQDRAPISSRDVWRDLFNMTASTSALIDTFQTAVHNLFGRAPVHEVKPGGHRYYPPGHDAAGVFNSFPDGMWDMYRQSPGGLALAEPSFEAMDAVIEAAAHHDVSLTFIATPNHAYFDYFIDTIGAWPLVEEWLRRITAKAVVYSFAQPNALTYEPVEPGMRYWYDPFHFSLEMGRAMQLSLLSRPEAGTPANFMVRLTPDKVAAHIEERRAAILKWAYANPDFVRRFEQARGDLAGGPRVPPGMDLEIVSTQKASGELRDEALVLNGTEYPTASRFAGALEGASVKPDEIRVWGWAADQRANAPVRLIVATMGDKVAAVSAPSVKRRDIEGGIASGADPAGFALRVPLAAGGEGIVRLYALMGDGSAVRIGSGLSGATGGRIEDYAAPPPGPYAAGP